MLLSHTVYSDGGDFRETAERIRAFELAGLDMAWVSESYGLDAVSRLAYLAARSERLRLGTAILPIFSRTPALLAQTAAGLDFVSGGRAMLGLGASGPQVVEGWHGVPYDRPLRRTREIVDILRAAWRRQTLVYEGACYTLPLAEGQGSGLGKPLKLITHPVRDRIPIYLAALRERSVETAAEIADGWLPIFFMPERAPEVWGGALSRGLARRAPELGRLEIVAGGLAAIGERIEHLRDLERPHLALYAGGMGARGANFYNELVSRYGFEAEARLVQNLFLEGKRKEAAAALPEALVRGTTLIGAESYVKERIAAYKEAGVTALNISPVGPDDPAVTVARFKELVSQV